jgi:hypothetical protein
LRRRKRGHAGNEVVDELELCLFVDRRAWTGGDGYDSNFGRDLYNERAVIRRASKDVGPNASFREGARQSTNVDGHPSCIAGSRLVERRGVIRHHRDVAGRV